MNLKELKQKLLWQMTGEEFLYLHETGSVESNKNNTETDIHDISEKRHVYGIAGIAELFGCSKPTAHRIKKSGKIDRAIIQIGRKIIVDAELALELAGRKTGGRR